MEKTADPAFSLPVSNHEKKIAEQIRKDFEGLLKELEKFSRYLLVFFDHADDLEGTENLRSLNPLIKRYEVKLKNRFNAFTDKLEEGLENYNNGFSDTELDNIRDLIIENTKNMRKGVIDLLKLFKKVEDPEFLKEVKDTYAIIQKSIDQLDFIIKDELFNHIDFDILGRIRLGVAQAPLCIKEAKNGI